MLFYPHTSGEPMTIFHENVFLVFNPTIVGMNPVLAFFKFSIIIPRQWE